MHCIISMLPGIITLLTHYMSIPFLLLYLVFKEMYHQGRWLFLFETQTTQYFHSCILTPSLPQPMKAHTTFLPVKALWTLVYRSWGFSNSCHCVSFPLFCSEKRGWEVMVSWSTALRLATGGYYSRLNLCSANVMLQRFNFNGEARPEDQVPAPKTRLLKEVLYLFHPRSTLPSPWPKLAPGQPLH